jgi:CheY-like chemotaxis protein
MGRVLVVDDDEDVRDVLRDSLEGDGHVVVSAAGAKEALALLELMPPPCVVLMDYAMPGMNGREFRDRQLAHAGLRGVPVILLTGWNVPQDAANGMSAVLHKPVELDVLLETVGRFCQRARLLASSS